jgi:hypothetical protein
MQHLTIITIVAFVLSVLFAVGALVLFFRFRIRDVIGELTGKTATEEIAKIREQGITRQGKARSLQVIIGIQGTDSGSFNLEKLGLGEHPFGERTAAASMPINIESSAASIQQVSASKSAGVQFATGEPETGLLQAATPGQVPAALMEPETSLLQRNHLY